MVYTRAREAAMEQRTHERIAPHLCGRPVELGAGRARVVLASAQVKFLGPVVAGDRVEAEAAVERSEGRRRWIRVVVRRDGTPVLEGELLAAVLDRHILSAT